MRRSLPALVLLIVLLCSFAPLHAESQCETFIQKLHTAFDNTNPALLDWDIASYTCSQSQQYEANYVQAKTAFYMEQFTRAEVQFKRALIISGDKDDEILFFLQEIAKSTNDKKGVETYADILQDKFPESHFSSDASESKKPWKFIFTSKSKMVLAKRHPLDDAYLDNKLSFQLTQSKGDLLLKESIGAGLKTERESSDTSLHSVPLFAEFLLLYKNLLFTAGYNLDFSYNDTILYDTLTDTLGDLILDDDNNPVLKRTYEYPYAWQSGSWFMLLNYDLPIKKRWELGHSFLFFSADSGYQIIDLSQTHTFRLTEKQKLSTSFSFEKDFIKDDNSIIRDLHLFTPQVQWIYRNGKNKVKAVAEFQLEREELDYTKALEDTIVQEMPDSIKSTFQAEGDTYTLEGYLSYKRTVSSLFSFDTRLGFGFEGVGDNEPAALKDEDDRGYSNDIQWTPYFMGRVVLTLSL